MWEPGKRLAVFTIKEAGRSGSIWLRAGTAFVNRDGSLNLLLDVLPLDGRLHVREALERKDIAQPTASATVTQETVAPTNELAVAS
ncbi:MAG: hypothetical protein ACKVPX_16745 [Myxococcaceae bacterium]